MEIENPNTSEFVSLLGAVNFRYHPISGPGIPEQFSFKIDWEVRGEGQEILREHLRMGTFTRMKVQGKQHQGVVSFHSGINTTYGIVVVTVE